MYANELIKISNISIGYTCRNFQDGRWHYALVARNVATATCVFCQDLEVGTVVTCISESEDKTGQFC